jgi:hypothetical protein
VKCGLKNILKKAVVYIADTFPIQKYLLKIYAGGSVWNEEKRNGKGDAYILQH